MSSPAEQLPAKTTTMAALKPHQTEVQNLPSVSMGFASLQSFELMQRAAKLLTASSLVPKDYQGNLPNCVIALNMAQRLGADPLMVMQNLYVVHGRPSWSAQFLIACFNQCGRYSTMKFRWIGERGKDSWGCIAYAKELSTGELIEGPEITIALSKEEGWFQKNGSKWKTIPQLMLMYRSAAWLVRTHAPELSMGLQTQEEIQDVYDATRDMDGRYQVTTESLRQVERQVSAETRSGTGDSGTEATPEAQLTLIRATKSFKELEDAYGEIVRLYVDANKGVPLDIEAAYGDHKLHLEQQQS